MSLGISHSNFSIKIKDKKLFEKPALGFQLAREEKIVLVLASDGNGEVGVWIL